MLSQPGHVDWAPRAAIPSRPQLQRCLDFVACFLAFFAAFRSFGVIAGFFLSSFFVLRSFDICWSPSVLLETRCVAE